MPSSSASTRTTSTACATWCGARSAHRGFECEYRIRLPNQTIRYVRGAGRPIQWEAGRPVEYIGTTVDITRQRQTEELLRKSETEFRSLAENSPDGVIRYDKNCNRVYVNPAYARHSGIPVDSAIRMPLDHGWRADIPAHEYKAMIFDVMRTGTPRQIIGCWTATDGHLVHFAVHVVPERNAEGAVVGALAISRNITAIQETERQLEESRQLLRRRPTATRPCARRSASICARTASTATSHSTCWPSA